MCFLNLSGSFLHNSYIKKKQNLVCSDTSSYRPTSNLSVISKLLERLILVRITKHLNNNKLVPINQSTYRQYHSTNTAALKVFSDILEATDHGQLTLLVLLDLSAAFDTVDHNILCQRLKSSFGFDGPALNWLRSYLNERECQIRIGDIFFEGFVCQRRSSRIGSRSNPLLNILRTYQESSPAMDCGHTSTPTIHMFMVIAMSIASLGFPCWSRRVLMTMDEIESPTTPFKQI